MQTVLSTALRESCGYLEDAGYHETARLMVLAADEIERLNARLSALEAACPAPDSRQDNAAATSPPGVRLVNAARSGRG